MDILRYHKQLTALEVANIMGVSKTVIDNAIAQKRLIYSEEGKRKAKKKKYILCFDFNGKFVCKYNSLSEAGRVLGRSPEAIRLAVKGKYSDAYGFFWMEEGDISDYKDAECVKKLHILKIEQINLEKKKRNEKKNKEIEKKMIDEFFLIFGDEIDYFPSKAEFEKKGSSQLYSKILNIYGTCDLAAKHFGLSEYSGKKLGLTYDDGNLKLLNKEQKLKLAFKKYYPNFQYIPSKREALKYGKFQNQIYNVGKYYYGSINNWGRAWNMPIKSVYMKENKKIKI